MHHGMWMVEGKSKRQRKGRSVKSDGSLILSGIPFQHPTIVFLLLLYPSTLVSLFYSPLSHLSFFPISLRLLCSIVFFYLFRFLVCFTFPFIHLFPISFFHYDFSFNFALGGTSKRIYYRGNILCAFLSILFP